MAPMLSPRTLPCVGAWLRIASESLECARAKMVQAASTTRRCGRWRTRCGRAATAKSWPKSRYWYGEMLYLLGDYGRADRALQEALRDLAVPEYGPWALHASGWTSLRLGDLRRAESAFRSLLGKPHPVPLDTWGRHGLGLALYGLGRWAEAEKAWSEVLGPPRARRARARPRLLAWRSAGPHRSTRARVAEAADLHPGRSASAAGGGPGPAGLALSRPGPQRPTPSPCSAPSSLAREITRDREWAEAGLALALVNAGDTEGAKRALPALDSASLGPGPADPTAPGRAGPRGGPAGRGAGGGPGDAGGEPVAAGARLGARRAG